MLIRILRLRRRVTKICLTVAANHSRVFWVEIRPPPRVGFHACAQTLFSPGLLRMLLLYPSFLPLWTMAQLLKSPWWRAPQIKCPPNCPACRSSSHGGRLSRIWLSGPHLVSIKIWHEEFNPGMKLTILYRNLKPFFFLVFFYRDYPARFVWLKVV